MNIPVVAGGGTIRTQLSEGNWILDLEFRADVVYRNDVWVQGRRLVLQGINGAAGQTGRASVAFNLRDASLPPPSEFEPGKDGVLLHPGEAAHPRWSTQLELRVTGTPGTLGSVAVGLAPDMPTLYLAGDSTVCDQTGPDAASWGQMLPAFFGPGLAVANHAESGETIKSFVTSLRLAKILAGLRRDDWLLIQFAHNDQKVHRPAVYADPEFAFPAWLRVLCGEAQARGARPLLLTPVERRNFDPAGRIVESHGAYPNAIRKLAQAEGIPLVDLHRASIGLYERLGPELSPRAFNDGGKDRSHHNAYGAWLLAAAVAEGLRSACPDLAAFLLPECPVFCLPDDFAVAEPVPDGPRPTEGRAGTILGN